jgi:thimet oligopeptidase
MKTLPIGLLLLGATTIAAADDSILIRSNYRKGEITKLCDAALAEAQASIEEIKGQPALAQMIISRSLLRYEKALAELNDQVAPLTFMAYVSKDADLRTEGFSCEEKVGQFHPSVQADKKLYQALKRAVPFTAAQKRLSSETLRLFEKNGMKLDDGDLEKLKSLKQELASAQTKYSLNLTNDKTTVAFTRAELEGVSENILSRLRQNASGDYVASTLWTDFSSIIENAKHAKTRKRMLSAFLNRASVENTRLLEEAVRIRAEIASLLGYPIWADVRTDGRMAKTHENAKNFLTGLKEKLAIRKDRDLKDMLKLKQELEPSATEILAEDPNYFAAQLKKRKYQIDDEKIAEYFPADRVVQGMFEIYSTLLGVDFVEVKDAKTWAEGVRLYAVHDQKSGDLLSYFYTDLAPRDGKYSHAGAFPLISGRILKPGRYSKPVAAIVANFTPATAARPSLLTHAEVKTFFHELGHIMQQILTKAPFATFSGTSVAQDYVEAPSQMMENWVWNREILKKISSHFQTGQPLSDELIDKMIAAKRFNQGVDYTWQLLFSLFDLRIHSSTGAMNVTKVYHEMYRDLFGFAELADGHFPAGFGHLMGGYDAAYYGYLWSQVYAQDMYSRFEREGLLNPKTGAEYRKVILESGNMQDAIDLIRRFLGREPNADAFYRTLGI